MQQRTITEKPVRVDDRDVLVLPRGQHVLFQQCCDCGLTHRIEVRGNNEAELRFRFINIGNGLPLELEPVTVLERM